MSSSPAVPPAVPEAGPAAWVVRAAAPVGLLVLLAAAIMLPKGSEGALRMASPDRTRVDQVLALIGELEPGTPVLIGFDPDMGTYPEIRIAVRAVFDDLAARGARVGVVSFTPEGRALAIGELARLARLRGTAADPLLPADLGFASGSEAALVRAVGSVVPDSASGPAAAAFRLGGGGIGAFALVVIVSGGDLGARSWVEQVGPRVPDLPMVAIAPTFLEPELAPYLRSGQLAGLLATLREGTAYAETVADDAGARGRPIAPLPMLVGMLVTLLVLAATAFEGVTGRMTPSKRGGSA